MELELLQNQDKKALVQLTRETLTLTNLLLSSLWQSKNVKEAAQIKEHPYLAEPKIFVRVERGTPLDSLEKAAEKALENLEELEEKFKRVLKG